MHLDDTDMQTINHKGSASKAVEGAEDWTWDEVGEDPAIATVMEMMARTSLR
jgi:hypothetical protein